MRFLSFFNSWLDMEGFKEMMEKVCEDFVDLPGVPKFIYFKNKLKALKNKIKSGKMR